MSVRWIVNEIIFTNKSKDWKNLIGANGRPFYMLHLNVSVVDNGVTQDFWCSKYYATDKEKESLLKEIEVWKEYFLDYKISWIYKNIVHLVDWMKFII